MLCATQITFHQRQRMTLSDTSVLSLMFPEDRRDKVWNLYTYLPPGRQKFRHHQSNFAQTECSAVLFLLPNLPHQPFSSLLSSLSSLLHVASASVLPNANGQRIERDKGYSQSRAPNIDFVCPGGWDANQEGRRPLECRVCVTRTAV